MLRSLITGAIVATALFAAAPAQPATLTRGDVLVRYDDLDLSRDADARVMLHRLDAAADQACGGRPSLRGSRPGLETFLFEDFRDCREATLANTITSLRAPAVTKLYAETRKQPRRLAGR
jgi:UrcA family protein